jgi:hypothetical protein
MAEEYDFLFKVVLIGGMYSSLTGGGILVPAL